LTILSGYVKPRLRGYSMLRSSQCIHLLLSLSFTLLFSTLLGFFIGLSMPSTSIHNSLYFSTYLSGFLTLWGLIIRAVVIFFQFHRPLDLHSQFNGFPP
jgi:hypothetical protein